MKWFKLLGILTLGAVFVGVASFATGSASPASANGGPHGGYTLTTSACAGCHRAHTAVGTYLTRAETIYGLCTTCHGGVAQTDVVHGVQTGGGGLPLNGGGFESYRGETATSSHTVEGLGGSSGIGTAWGSQDGNGDSGVGVANARLECTSCHNPHGSTNYRILNDAGSPDAWELLGLGAANPDLLDWVDYQVQATRDDAPNYAFNRASQADCPPRTVGAGTPTPTPGPGTNCIARYTSGAVSTSGTPTPGPGTPALSTIPDKTLGMNAFCATCHKSYLTSSSAYRWNSLNTPAPGSSGTGAPATQYMGLQDANDGHGLVARYRHSVGRTTSSVKTLVLRFAARGNDPDPAGSLTYDAMGCLTCHFAHGTNAEATGFAAGVAPSNDSALLQYDNRGVCIGCHGNSIAGLPPGSAGGYGSDGQPWTPTPTP